MNAESMRSVDLNGFQLRYLEQGNGPVLLLIHGLGATHADWRQQVDFFSRVFRVIAPDLRGHGESAGEAPFTVDRLATDLSQMMDVLKVGSFFVMGHSMGGAVAMQLALFKPERVKKLVLADTLPSFIPNSWKKRLMLWTRLFIMRVMGPNAMARHTAKKLFPKPDQEPLREQMIMQNTRTPKPVYVAMLKALSRWSVVDRLFWLQMPVFVLAGDHDYFLPDEAQTFAENLPDGRCHILEGARHHLPLERADEFNRIVMDFLMPGSHIASIKGEVGLNWLRIDPAAQKKIDVQALLRKPK